MIGGGVVQKPIILSKKDFLEAIAGAANDI